MKYVLIFYFLFCSFFFGFFSSGFIDSQDGLQYLAIARRMYYDQTLEMPEETYATRENIHMNTFEAADGKRYALTGLGYSLALLPAVVVEDITLRIHGNEPISAFPLENDWPVLLAASFVNAVFGALLVTSFFYFLYLQKLPTKQALALSFLLAIGSNVFVYTKHSFAHMMFTAFMMTAFVFIKRHAITHKKIDIFLAGISFGLVVITYNQSYLFTIPALGLYYLLTHYTSVSSFFQNWRNLLLDGILGIAGSLPFYLINQSFFSLRTVHTISNSQEKLLSWLKPYVFVEGFWGVLLSPGKSIFVYSPVIILLVIFWFKFPFKKYRAELIAFGTLFITYLIFIGLLMGGPNSLVWHGESSFGNRYMMTPLVGLLVLVALLVTKLSTLQKRFIFYPLIILGLCIQLTSILQPYQIKFSGLQQDVKLNGRYLNVYEYGNFIPRYTPVFTMSKQLVKKIANLDSLLNHGPYNLRLYDGFDFPFPIGNGHWREIMEEGHISFGNNNTPTTSIGFSIKNHQFENPTSSYSAELAVSLNETQLPNSIVIEPNQEATYNFTFDDQNLFTENNHMVIQPNFIGTDSARLKNQQIIFLQSFEINGATQNIATIDYPYVSQMGNVNDEPQYKYWGNIQTDPWEIWNMHSAIFEKTFDLWWLRPFHYWDMPNLIFSTLFVINVAGTIYFGWITWQASSKKPTTKKPKKKKNK